METGMRLDEKQNLLAVELSDEDIEIVSGGENCIYASQTYSPGSLVKMSDGNNHTCQADGTWK
jgi:hypothetical protein